MARIAVDDNLAFVAAALSALTEKQIVPRREYDVIKEKIRKGEDTGYVCKGEANVVEEIKQTYAKTAVLVAMKYHPELVENGELKPFHPKKKSKMKSSGNTGDEKRGKSWGIFGKKSQKTGGISKIASQGSDNIPVASMANSSPTNPTDTISVSSEISTLTKTMPKISPLSIEVPASRITHPDRAEGINSRKGDRNARKLYDLMKDTQEGSGDSSASHSQIDESERSPLLTEIATGRKMFFADSKPEISDSDSEEDCIPISRRKRMTQVPKLKMPSMHSDSRHYSSGEDVLNCDDEKLIEEEKRDQHKHESEKVTVETSSDEEVQVFSDDKCRLMKGKKQKIRRKIHQTLKFDEDSISLPQDKYHRLQDIEPLQPERFKSEAPRDDNCIDLLVVLPSGKTIVITVESRNYTIAHLKELINAKTDFLEKDQVLHFGANLLRNDATISDYDITSNSTIHLSIKLRGGCRGGNLYYLDSKYLHPQFDYDFTNMTDDGTKYERGGHPYNRPYGWKRIAIKSLGKYENNDWLVKTGANNGEWAVSYHGTSAKNFNSICKQGYIIGTHNFYGRGVYSSPLIEVALGFSKKFTYNGVEYQGILQNRVNPKAVSIVNNGRIWFCPNENDIRPYGLCIKKCT